MRSILTLCVLALFAAPVLAADTHPPIGAIVVAVDNGKQMRHVGGGHFVEVTQATPAQARGSCVCGPSCACPAGVCESGSCPVQTRPVYLPQSVVGGCVGGSCGLPSQSFYAAPAYSFPQSSCANGQCGIPQAQPRGLFRR